LESDFGKPVSYKNLNGDAFEQEYRKMIMTAFDLGYRNRAAMLDLYGILNDFSGILRVTRHKKYDG
jgi:hypothetical protein